MLKGIYKFPYYHKCLDFKDVMIIPKRSDIISRKDVSLKRTFTFKTKQKIISWTGVPIISSNMDTVSDLNTFGVLLNHDYITCFPKHFNKTWNEKLDYPLELLSNTDKYMITTGINNYDVSETIKLINNLKD
jgi:GMP reductase